LEEVLVSKGGVVEAVAESGSGFFAEPVLLLRIRTHNSRVDFDNSITTI